MISNSRTLTFFLLLLLQSHLELFLSLLELVDLGGDDVIYYRCSRVSMVIVTVHRQDSGSPSSPPCGEGDGGVGAVGLKILLAHPHHRAPSSQVPLRGEVATPAALPHPPKGTCTDPRAHPRAPTPSRARARQGGAT